MLRTANIHLRTVREVDLPTLYGHASDPASTGDHYPFVLESEPSFYRSFHESGWWQQDHGRLVITDLEHRILGWVSYFHGSLAQPSLDIGFRVFDPADRGKGVATQACSLLVAYLFETREIPRLQAMTTPDNHTARRVLEKSGFSREGTARHATFLAGEYRDLEVYSILRGEQTPLRDLMPFDSQNPSENAPE